MEQIPQANQITLQVNQLVKQSFNQVRQLMKKNKINSRFNGKRGTK